MAPLGLAFYSAQQFPTPYRDSLYVAFHGSWNRSAPAGYKVMRVRCERGDGCPGRSRTSPTRLAERSGRVPGDGRWPAVGGRRALVSDDKAGFIYRIAAEGLMNGEDWNKGVLAQQAQFRRRLAAGMPRAGWKVCVNDLRLQGKLGIDGVFAGFPRRLPRAPAAGRRGRWRKVSLPGVEPEFALCFRGRGGARTTTPTAIRRAIAGAAPALEIVDWKDAKLDLASIADVVELPRRLRRRGNCAASVRLPRLADGWPVLSRGTEVLAAPDPSLVPEDLSGPGHGGSRGRTRTHAARGSRTATG